MVCGGFEALEDEVGRVGGSFVGWQVVDCATKEWLECVGVG